MLWVLIFSMATGGVTLQVQIYLIFCIVLGLFVTSVTLARLSRVKLELLTDLPSHSTSGASVTITTRVRNRSRHGGLDVVLREIRVPHHVEERPLGGQRIPWLPTGEAATVTRTLSFTRRGAYTLPGLRQEGLFPFGLWKDLVDHRTPHTVLVYPRFHPLVSLDIPAGVRYQPGGIALTSQLGDSIEFIGTREYREGDSPRSIHHKTWARIGRPAVKEFQAEYFCRIALLMDTFTPEPPPPRPFRRRPDPPWHRAFEAAVSVAASVADALSREEYVIDIFAAGPELYHLQSGRSLAYLENVLDILACIEPCHEAPFEKIAPVLLEHLESVTTTVVVMLDWDEARERVVQTVLDHGSAVKLIIVRDGPTTLDIARAHALCGEVRVITSDEEAAGLESL